MAMYVDTSVPSLNLGDEVPNFEAESLKGPLVLHDWINDQQTWEPGEETWVLILLLPKPRHPVVASEFVKLGSETLQKQLKLRRVRVVCIVADTLYSVRSFLNELDELGEEPPDLSSVQILVDDDCELHRLFGGVRPGAENGAKGRVPSLSLYLVSPQLEVELIQHNAICCGHNFPEIVRAIDSIQIHKFHPRIGTWANWEAGADDTLILPRFEDGEIMSELECEEAFPKGHFEALYPYFRITPIPDTPGVNIFPEGEGEDDRDDA